METLEHFALGFQKKKISIFIKINKCKRRKRKKINHQLHLQQADTKQRVLHPERQTRAAGTRPPLSFPSLGRVFFFFLLS